MAREIDLSKPLSDEDIKYLLERYSDTYVERMIALAGSEKAEEEPEDTSGGEGTPSDPEDPEDPDEDLIGGIEDFDPGVHTAEEVVAYLKTASEEEKARVQEAESDGKGRSTILNF